MHFEENTRNNYSFSRFHYIHQDPVEAGLVRKIEAWEYSSFKEYYQSAEIICNGSLAVELLGIPADTDLFYKQSYLVINDLLIQKNF